MPALLATSTEAAAVGRIWTVASSKGGGGKTAFCCCLAPNLSAHAYRVGVIDADPNGTFSEWHRNYRGPLIRCQAEARDIAVVDLAQAWAEQLDVVVIDTAGFGNLTAAAAMGAADHVFVPCMPDRGSTRESAKTIAKTASLARAARRTIGASVVLSQWRAGGMAEAAALEDLADYGITAILRTALPERSAFRRMSFDSKALTSGPVGPTIDTMIAELVQLGVLAPLAELAEHGDAP
jgi:chromosome partitioning protein